MGIGYHAHSNDHSEPRSFFARHRQAVLSVLFTVAWMVCAHAYRWFNATSASHDGLAFYSGAAEALHQVGLGRFLVPVYTALRGGLAAPFLVGVLACAFTAVAVLLVVKTLDLKHAAVICGVAGALGTSISATLLNASYTNWFDVDMLALLLAVAAVHCTVRWKRGFVAGGALLMASMALYQAYLDVFLGMALIVLAADALAAEQPANLGRKALRLLGALVVGGVLYFACMKAAIALTAASVIDEYNSLSNVGNFSGMSLPRLLVEAYLLPVAYLLTPETHLVYLAGAANAALAVASVAGAVVVARSNRAGKAQMAVLVASVVMLPLAVDAVYVVSRGMMHGLMIQSFALFYVAVLLVADRLLRGGSQADALPTSATGQIQVGSVVPALPAFAKILATGMAAIAMAVSCCNVVYANDLYVTKDLQAQATLSHMTRIADRMSQVEGYVPGQTEVVFVGSLDESYALGSAEGLGVAQERPLLQSVTGGVRGTGFYSAYAVTYPQTYGEYFTYLLGERIVMAPDDVADQYAQLPAVQQLASYPSSDCCALVDGRLVVKLS